MLHSYIYQTDGLNLVEQLLYFYNSFLKHTLLFSGENRKSVPDGLGSAQDGKPAVHRPDSTPFPLGHPLLRCKVTVIYNAVK